MQVLIADDEFLSRKVFRSLLAGCETQMVFTGAEALDAYREALDQGRTPDLIFLDVMMPGMDGLKAQAAMRELEKERGLPPCTIIVVSALDDCQAQDTAPDKVFGYITKPLTREKLIHELDRFGLSLP